MKDPHGPFSICLSSFPLPPFSHRRKEILFFQSAQLCKVTSGNRKEKDKKFGVTQTYFPHMVLSTRTYRNCVTLFFSDLYEGDESRSPIRPYWNHTFFCKGHPEGENVPGNNGARTGKNDFYFPGINFWCWRKKERTGTDLSIRGLTLLLPDPKRLLLRSANRVGMFPLVTP